MENVIKTEVSQINIEEIMKEIRAEILDNGYKLSEVSFDDIPIKSTKSDNYPVGIEFAREVSFIDYLAPLPNFGFRGRVKIFFRKCFKFLLLPIVEQQNEYNGIMVRTVKQLQRQVDQLSMEIKDKNLQILDLEKKLEELSEKEANDD